MTLLDEKQALPRTDSTTSTTTTDAAGLHASGDSNADSGQVTPTYAADGFVVPDLTESTPAPPAYEEQPRQIQVSQPGFEADANVTGDGRVNVNINTKNRRLADLLVPSLERQLTAREEQGPLPPAYIPPSLGGQPGQTPPPRLNVVIQIVGSRGDVQPFVALGKVLRDTYGHRVRLATHPTFQSFVEENGLEFFSIGGDPAELMAFMVKHPGLMPGIDALKSGEITRRRKGIQDMLLGCWRSSIESGDGLGPPPAPHAKNEPLDLSRLSHVGDRVPFVADAIIANPPSFAHIHIAEKLGIPLHMMFTMPWTPTRAFPHPLANIQSSNLDEVLTNYLTYSLVELMTRQGLGDVVNRFREKALDLPPLSQIWSPGLLNRLRIPYTYCWSPSLIPKPSDWGNYVDIAGFFFLDLASSFTPEPELAAFLAEGPPPVYIGFGSIVVDDPNAMTKMIFDAVRMAGVRALVSKGWGGLGADELGIPEGVFMLGNVPHDWLFKHVSCVVHHGGAGTTAAGIKAGKPTLVVPFFGDQPFWGAMIARANAGPAPIPYASLTAEKLAEAIKVCLKDDTLEQAKLLGQKIREEKGTDVGGQSFHSHLHMDSLRCHLAPSRTAVWRVRRSKVRLSALAAAVVVDRQILKYSDLKLHRPVEYNTEDQPPDPITAGASSLVMDVSSIGMSIADMPRQMFKSRSRLKEMEAQRSRDASRSNSEVLTTTTSNADSIRPSMTDSSAASIDSANAAQASASGTERASPVAESNDPQSESPRPPSHRSTTLESGSQPPESTRSRSSSFVLKEKFAQRDSSPVGVSIEAAISAGKGVGNIVTTGVKSPMNFCLGLAKGFRNVPKLYNDSMIRPVEKVTDLPSGLRVASKEFGFGVYDGITGLVTQPLRGAEKEGAGGLLKGIGKGFGGLITKPAAGAWGVPAYMMQGVHAEVSKMFTKSVQNYVITSRVIQGQKDLKDSSTQEQEDIVMRWNALGDQLKAFEKFQKKGREAAKEGESSGSPPAQADTSAMPSSGPPKTGWRHTRKLSFESRKRLQAQKEAWKGSPAEESAMSAAGPSTVGNSNNDAPTGDEDAAFEQAIQASVRETSRGDPREDTAIEAAVRSSVNAARNRAESTGGTGYAADLKDPTIFQDEDYEITDEEYQQLIERAVQQSIASMAGVTPGDLAISHQGQAGGSSVATGSGTTRSDNFDADLQQALEASRNQSAGHRGPDDSEFERAMAASKEEMQKQQAERREEDIVMEYTKKQSLAEEEFRKRKLQEQKASQPGEEHGGDDNGDDVYDDEMRRATEESLRAYQGHGEAGPSGTT